MRINQNISAMNTYSRLTSANTGKSNSLAKLSSGLRINKAGDDAAGLAISEKMRGQVGGLKQAVRNAQDGISLIQTAEGALNETHSILNRMRDLAVQASNGTNTDADRGEIQKEMDQLAEEITRIGNTTQFNTMELLNGKLDTKFHIGANTNQSMDLKIGDLRAENLGVVDTVGHEAVEAVEGVEAVAAKATVGDIEITAANGKAYDVSFVNGADNGSLGVEVDDEAGTIVVTLADDGTDPTSTLDQVAAAINAKQGLTATVTGTGNDTAAEATGTLAGGTEAVEEVAAREAREAGGGIYVLTREKADEAIAIIDDAVAKVSEERSNLGSVQNRLEHTINNLTATAENLSAAESRIRDVDMAEEMMEFTKNNILSQAATAMLAQANQMPNSVLQLLQ